MGYALRLFELVVPGAVRSEIMRPDVLYPARVYPDAALFEEVQQLMTRPPLEEPQRLDMFGGGEAAAIPLAQQLEAVVLINDRRPALFARSLGMTVFNVPDMIVLLKRQGLIPEHMARALLRMSQQHGTSPLLVEAAEQLLDLLGSA